MIRRSCVLVSLLALVLQGSTGGHMLLVEHARCAEHGDLVHLGEGHAHEAAPRHDVAVTTVDGTRDSDSDDGHEHCAMSADRRDVEAMFADPVEVRLSTATDSVSRPHHCGEAVPTARYRVAPKNSPPA